MIEQINVLLNLKVREFLSLVIEACRRRLTSEKRAYTSIKSDENGHLSGILPPKTGRYCKFAKF